MHPGYPTLGFHNLVVEGKTTIITPYKCEIIKYNKKTYTKMYEILLKKLKFLIRSQWCPKLDHHSNFHTEIRSHSN
jgi:hypothetical protein